MNDYIEQELNRLRAKKSILLAELGQSVYYQYRIGQIYSEELSDISQEITELDQNIFKLQTQNTGDYEQFCGCGHLINNRDQYCSNCGSEVQKQTNTAFPTCTQCGVEAMSRAVFAMHVAQS
ncbi:hypothetical protein [Piscibacillus salipiscarius]|uniref:hypothetical protein n=1 Tax=Piscibacillus salipiscarius TaxID=299480 RepID=UPI0006D10B7E|nr:hypothetical protein [Piscibacillus salipiscarius]